MRWILAAISFIALTVAIAAFMGRPNPVNLSRSEIGKREGRTDIDFREVRNHLEMLNRPVSRLTGTPGCAAARQYILDELAAVGISAGDIELQEFEVPVPVTGSARLESRQLAEPVILPVHPLWPNLARTCRTPPDGLSGRLIDGGRGTEEDLAGKPLRGSIVVLDWACDLEWLSIPEFGATAVIFKANDEATGYTARNKFLSVPADIPRYYLEAAQFGALDRILNDPAPLVTLHCDSEWRRTGTANILARINPGTGDREHHAPIVFHAYYDSISVVPGLAPGAEQACGAALLLGLSRHLHQASCERPVYALFTGGHGQAMSGMLNFVQRLKQGAEGETGSVMRGVGTPGLFVGLDFSSRSDQFGIFALGVFRSLYESRLRPKFSVLGSELSRYAASFHTEGAKDDTAREQVIDCINLTRGRSWWTYFPFAAGFESETATVAGIPGITLATVNDDRRYVDTPGDRFERLRLDLLEAQVAVEQGEKPGLAAICHALAQWNGPFVSSPITDAWASLEGRAVWLDQEKDYVPSEPLANALIFLKTRRGDKHLMGTRGIPVVMTDQNGAFAFHGLVQMTENWQFRNCLLEAYATATPAFTDANAPAMEQYRKTLAGDEHDLDPATNDGSILYAVDMARPNDYPWEVEIRTRQQHLNVVCFPCRALTLSGLTDPRGYLPLTDLKLLEAATLASPFQYGQSIVDSLRPDEAESMVTIWADPGVRTMLTLGLGFQEKRLVLINGSPGQPQGKGFVFDDLSTLPSMVLQGAGDMHCLDAARAAKLAANGVRNPRLDQFHESAGDYLAEARSCLDRHDYRGYRTASERAWALEGKAYTEILSLINNMIRGVLFYLALLLPFSYCLERLLIASGSIKRRIVWIGVIFAACFLLLAAVHPAFRFTMTPFLVLLAFVIVALVVTVSVLIVSRMDAVLQERKRHETGRHDEARNLGGIAVRAVDLGISNIRRRPQRGFLTALTVVTVTFILLSFISLTPAVSISRLRHPDGVPTYRGLLIRDRAWAPLPNPLYASIRRSMGETAAEATLETGYTTAGRAWFFSDLSGKLSQIDLTRADSSEKPPLSADKGETGSAFTAVALLCLGPNEPAITGIDQALVAGRWFLNDDEKAVILPAHVASQLGYGTGDLGRLIRIFGEELPLIGILDAAKMDQIPDIDGEPLTPVNFVLQQQLKAENTGDDDTPIDTLEEYVHYASDQVAVIPFQLGRRLGATIRSIAVKGGPDTPLDKEAEGYTKRSNLTILACDGKQVTLYAALNTSQLSAAWQIMVPVFLGFIMVLGTMLGSVYERRREIFVYNSVGLSPGNVASLFLAESSVYAVMGAGMGYLLGQITARVLQATGWLSGLNLNYTAGSTILVTVLTMLIVLLSTLFPARQAFHAAIPDVEKETDTPGAGDAGSPDQIRFFLPFVASPANVLGMQAYMREFLTSIEGVTVGQLAVDSIGAHAEHADGQIVPVLSFRAWVAPFDLGISQQVDLRILYRQDRGVHQYHLTATRFSGDHQNWYRLMPRFVSTIRRQLLLWRVLSEQDVSRYREAGTELFQENPRTETV